MRLVRSIQRPHLVLAVAAAALITGISQGLLATCGPFTDVAADTFCPFVLEIFYLGITTGTTPTTYDPTGNVIRLQMAAFLSRTVDGVLKRGSRRAALDRFWTPQNAGGVGLTTVGTGPAFCRSDGGDVWVGNEVSATVSRVRGTDAKLLETWTGATFAYGVLLALNRVLVTGHTSPGRLYAIDPSQPAGAVTTVASTLGTGPNGIVFDGARVWTANAVGSVSIVTPGAAIPWTTTTVATGGNLQGALFDGISVWVTDVNSNRLLKLDSAGAVLQTVTVRGGPEFPAFDGTSIWVPNANDNSVSVVRASTGAVLQTLTGNGLSGPFSAAFDGERVLLANFSSGTVSVWKAADLSPIGSVGLGGGITAPQGACSDGANFWITLYGTNQLAKF